MREIMPTSLQSRALTQTDADTRSTIAHEIINWNVLLTLGFCALGLLITLNVMLRFPDLGALIERSNQF
jgi:hypothetical protein